MILDADDQQPGDAGDRIQLPAAPWLAHYEPEVSHSLEVPDVTLQEFFARTARDYPGATSTIFFGERLSYAQLDEQTSQFASALQSIGVQKGDRVALVLPNCPQFLVALYGALKAGAVVIPLNPAYVPRELGNIFSDAGVETVVALNTAAQRVAEVMPDSPVKRLVVTQTADYLSPLLSLMLMVNERRVGSATPPVQGDGIYSLAEIVRNSPAEYAPPGTMPDDTALLLYTGGTTGTPKGAMLSHRNLVSNALQMSAWVWDARPERHETFLGVIPFFHSYGFTVVMNLAIAVAGAIVLLPRFNLKEVLRAIARFRPTVFPAVPTIYNAIAHHPLASRYDLRSIRVCISGAAPLPPEVVQAFESVTGARLVEGYGLTETSPVTHCNPIHGERRVGSIGLPVPLTAAQVVDPDTREALPTGEVGELAVCGPQVMQGYWNREEETEQVMGGDEGRRTKDEGNELSSSVLRPSSPWLYTGDMARMDEDGYFYVVDRKKDLVLVNGMNVYPREVEDVLYESEKVQEVVVAGVPDKRYGEVVKAYVVLKPDLVATESELRKFCAERLAPYKVPARIVFCETLPKSSVGKYLRRQLIEEDLGRM